MRRRDNKPTPTYRAGLNLREDVKSGYARTYVLGQENLFPNEGYEFPQRDVSQRKNLYKISEDSPFNIPKEEKVVRKGKVEKVIQKNREKWLETETACTKCAAQAISMPTPGELRSINSEIAAQAVRKDLNAQVALNEKIRLAQMKEDAHWAKREYKEGLATQEINSKIKSRKMQTQQALANDYREQFALHAKMKEEEKRQDMIEAEVIKKQMREEELKDRIRQEKLRQLAHERQKEFQQRNEELLQRKEKRIEDDIAAEKLIAKQKAEVDARIEERRKFEKERREHSTRIRNRLIEKQSKQLEETLAKQQKWQGIAESELTKRQEAERKRQEQIRKDMADERRRDWLQYQREKSYKIMNKTYEPDYYTTDNDDYRRADEEFRRKKLIQLKKDQQWQIEDRRRKEKEETDYRRRHFDNQFFLKDNEW